MALVGPPPLLDANPLSVLISDLRAERSATVPFPPGETSLSPARTRAWAEDPLPILLSAYERYGPVFTLRLFHSNIVFMLGPAANHYITVSHASNFSWREGSFRDLIGLMGDGLLTIDGEFHRRSRMIMLPAFHREQHRRLGRRGDRGDDAGARAAGAGRVDRPLRVDPAASRCGSRCAACSGSIRTASRPARSTARDCSRTRSGSTRASTCCACSAGAARRGGGCRRPRASSTR